MTRREQYAAMSYLLLEEYEAHLRAANRSPETIASRLRVLQRLHEHLTLGLVFAKTAEIEAFLSALQRKGRGRWTISRYYTDFRQFYAWADAAGRLDGNPTLAIKRPRPGRFRPRPATRAQVELALSSPEPWHTIYALAYYAGLRAGEIAACWREDFTEEVTFIPRGKGGDPATVPTHPYIWTLISPRPPGPLFLRRDGTQVDGHWVSMNARRQFARLGAPGLHVHQLRHSFATDLLTSGVDIRTVQECLRHSSLNTTSAYTEVTSARKRAAVASLPPLGTPAGL